MASWRAGSMALLLVVLVFMAAPTRVECKMQKVADRRAMVRAFPGCAMLGADSTAHSDGWKYISTKSVATPGACQQECLLQWKKSDKRGIQLWSTANSWSACFRHEGCYLQVSMFADHDESCAKKRQNEDFGFEHDETNAWRVWPCYDGALCNGDAATDPLPCNIANTMAGGGKSDPANAMTQNFSTGKQSNNADKLKVEIADSPYICKWARENQDHDTNSSSAPCLQWKWVSNGKCHLYNRVIESERGTLVKDSEMRVSGNLYCDNDFNEETTAKDFANVYTLPGCAQEGWIWAYGNLVLSGENPVKSIQNVHDCRRKCQGEDACVIFVYDTARKVCWLKNADAFRAENRIQGSIYTSGSKDCRTCLPGFYIDDVDATEDSCTPCPTGYYCTDGETVACSGGQFCGHEGQRAELAVGGENVCAEDRSGVGCQHRVCRDSVLGAHLASLDFVEPKIFDFGNYALEDWDIVQVVSADHPDAPAFAASFADVIGTEMVSGYKLVVGNRDIAFANRFGNCSNHDVKTVRQELLLYGYGVGDTFNACLELDWLRDYKPNTWKDLTSDGSTAMKMARHCQDGIVRFAAHGDLLVNDINANAGSEGVVITYTIGTSDQEYTVTTGTTGTVGVDFFDDIATANLETSSYVTILSATKPNADTDIKLCPDDETVECTLENARELPATYSMDFLATRSMRLVDMLSRTLSGTVEVPFGAESCSLEGVLVEALNLDASAAVVASAYTQADGTFVLNVPTNTNTQLVFDYVNHTFSAASGAGASTVGLLSESGLQVSEAISGIAVVDTTERDFNLRAAATLCDIPFGSDVGITITVGKCPGIVISKTTSKIYSDYKLPATDYTFALTFEDDAVQEDFEYQFPAGSETARVLNLTLEDVTVEMLHQPVPVLDVTLLAGEVNFEAPSCTDLPFEAIVEGGKIVHFQITSTQSYGGSTCGELPAGTTVEVTSELAPEMDVACDPNAPCNVAFAIEEVAGVNRSVSHGYALAGEPQRPLSDKTSHGPAEFVRRVAFVTQNLDQWALSSDGLDMDLSLLVVGAKTIREASTLAFASEDSVPLHYVYAPPGTSGMAMDRSFATLTFEGSFSTTTKTNAVVENSLGVSTSLAVTAAVESKSFSVESTTSVGVEVVGAKVESYEDKVSATTESSSFTLTTPADVSGYDANMVLYLGSVAKVSEAVYIDFNEASCRVESMPSITWGNQLSAMVYYSRKASENALDLIERTIAVEGSKPGSEDLVALAKTERERWLALFQHWDNDYQAAFNYPVDISGASVGSGASTSTNRLQFSAGQFEFSEERSTDVDTVVDYESMSSSFDISLAQKMAVTGKIWSIKNTAEVSGQVSFRRSVSLERIVTQGDSNTMTAHTTISSEDPANELCLEFYRSPFSGTHVYRVCGGLTACPHIPGTDAREVFGLSYDEEPDAVLEEDTGSFSFYIDTSSMPVSDDTIELEISVDAQSATGRIAYRMGASSLNQPTYITMWSRQKQLVTVFYERLDERVRSTTVTLQVASACDPGVSRTLPFDLNWASTCPTVSWSGLLASHTATWTLSSSGTTLPISYARGPASDPSVESSVALWAARYEGGVVIGEWFQVTSFADGVDSLSLDVAQLNGMAQGRYLFELRATCTLGGRAAGSTRSGQRLGVYDVSGPVLEAWAPIKNVRMAASSFPVAQFRFDEPVNCGSASLQATMTDASGSVTAQTRITCSSRLYDLVVVMETDAAGALAWSNTTATIVLEGVYDLYGNAAETVVAGGGRRVLSEGLSKTFTTPVLPEHTDGATLGKWSSQSSSEKREAVAVAFAKVLPSNNIIASTYVVTDDEEAGASESSVLGIAIGVTCGALVVIGGAFLALRRRRRRQSQAQVPFQMAMPVSEAPNAKVESANPIFATA